MLAAKTHPQVGVTNCQRIRPTGTCLHDVQLLAWAHRHLLVLHQGGPPWGSNAAGRRTGSRGGCSAGSTRRCCTSTVGATSCASTGSGSSARLWSRLAGVGWYGTKLGGQRWRGRAGQHHNLWRGYAWRQLLLQRVCNCLQGRGAVHTLLHMQPTLV